MIAIIDYGLGNLESVKYALDRLGAPSVLTSDPAAIVSANGVILPGVGAFGRAMEKFRELELVDAARSAAASGRPFMGICLGLQMLFSSSEEHGRHEGLGIVPGRVVRFPHDLTVPHMGWNQVRQEWACPLFEDVPDESFFYFAHSYYAEPANPAAAVGSTDYGRRYASTIQQGSVFATQYHPEKSGPVGLKMLANFVRLCKTA